MNADSGRIASSRSQAGRDATGWDRRCVADGPGLAGGTGRARRRDSTEDYDGRDRGKQLVLNVLLPESVPTLLTFRFIMQHLNQGVVLTTEVVVENSRPRP